MGVQVTTRNNTRNQLTVDFQVKRFCIFDNNFIPAVFNNNSGAALTNLVGGFFVARNVAVADQVIPVTSANLADVIGVAVFDGTYPSLANAGTLPISVVINGVIDATMLQMPSTVTLETTVGNKAFKDILNGLGFKMDQSTVENTKFDN